MKKKFKIIAVALLVVAAGLFLGYTYIMKGGERNLQTEEATFRISADELSAAFSENAAAATKKYLNKAVEVTGKITSSKGNELVLNANIICTMQKPTQLNAGESISVKGRVLGFDDLMGEIKLDQCYLTK